MASLDELIINSNSKKQVIKYYNLIIKYLEQSEKILAIEIDLSFNPKALILTDVKVLECKSRSLYDDVDILFYAHWDVISDVQLTKGFAGDQFCFNLLNTNLIYNSDFYEKASSFITLKLMTECLKSVTSDQTVIPSIDVAQNDELETKLIKLKGLYDRGLISEEEYIAQKKTVLNSL